MYNVINELRENVQYEVVRLQKITKYAVLGIIRYGKEKYLIMLSGVKIPKDINKGNYAMILNQKRITFIKNNFSRHCLTRKSIYRKIYL